MFGLQHPSVDLAFDRIDGARPLRAIAFLHGILGRRKNIIVIYSS